MNPDGHLFQPLRLFLLPPVLLLPFLLPSPQGPRIKHAITLYRLVMSWMKRHKSIQLRAEVPSPGGMQGVGPAMVPQETFVVSERNHPSRPCPPFLAPRPFRYLCESQEAKAKLCSRSLIHSQGEGRSIQGNEGRQH